MINKVIMKNFKNFDELEIDNLSRITLIGGKNNIGKTTFLEALFMFYDRNNPALVLRQMLWRGMNGFSLTPKAVWAPIFHTYDVEKQIEIKTFEEQEEALLLNFNPNYVQKKEAVAQSTHFWGRDSVPIEIRDSESLLRTSLDMKYSINHEVKQSSHLVFDRDELKLNFELPVIKAKRAIYLEASRKFDPNEDANRFGSLDVKGELNSIIEIMKIIEPRLKSISSIAMGKVSVLHGDIGLSRKIPISYMGDGTSRLLSTILAIADNRDGVVFIDEIENGIHYSIMPEILNKIALAAKKFNCQIFASTHSYECLKSACEGLKDEYEDDFSYVRLDEENGKIVPKIYSHEMLDTAIDRGWEVR